MDWKEAAYALGGFIGGLLASLFKAVLPAYIELSKENRELRAECRELSDKIRELEDTLRDEVENDYDDAEREERDHRAGERMRRALWPGRAGEKEENDVVE